MAAAAEYSPDGRYHKLNERLGTGAFKTVWKAFDTLKQVDVAWNSIDLSGVSDFERGRIEDECKMLQKLDHENILKMHKDIFLELDNGGTLTFITDIMQNGSIRSYFSKRKINLGKMKSLCRQILRALHYLHSKSIIHRDLKCDNIFMDSDGKRIVIGDLGLSRVQNGAQTKMSIVGTPYWMAPEVYQERYTALVDIWSFGMCVLELITNSIPYIECKGPMAVYNKVFNDRAKPQSLSTLHDPYIRDFIRICIEFDPRTRPTAQELLDHPFLIQRESRDHILCHHLIGANANPNALRIDTDTDSDTDTANDADKHSHCDIEGRTDTEGHIDIDTNTHSHSHSTATTATTATTLKANHTLKVPMSGSTKRSGSKSNGSKSKTKSTRSKRRGRSKSEVTVDDVTAKRECITTIKLQIYRKHEHPITVTFDFNSKVDVPEAVSAEMVRELALPDRYQQKVERAIEAAIAQENGPQTQIIGNSLTRSRLGDPLLSAIASANNMAPPPPPAAAQREGAGTVTFAPNAVPRNKVSDRKARAPGNGVADWNQKEIHLDLQPFDLYIQNSMEEDPDGAGSPIEVEPKAKDEIARRRDELLREFKEFKERKQELLKLKDQSALDATSRSAERRLFEEKMERKKSEIEKQWKNFIADYRDIAQYTSSKMANFTQMVAFEEDPPFQRLKKSELLSDSEKYHFEDLLKQYRAKMVADYTAFYTKTCARYAHLL